MLWLRRQNLTKASWTTSSASAADCTHCRAKSSKRGATSEKQLFQSSWLAILSMTFSRSLLSRRRQVEILSPCPGERTRRPLITQNFSRTFQRLGSALGEAAAQAISRTNRLYGSLHRGWRFAVPLSGRYSTLSK